MTAKLFLITLLCIHLLEITSTTLLQRAKRICRKAAHNWRIIKSPPRKLLTKNVPTAKRMFPKPKPKPYLKFRTEIFPVEVKYSEDHEESVTIEIDDSQVKGSKIDKFTLLHKMDEIVDIAESEHVVTNKIELTYDFDEFDDFLDAIDLFEIPTIDSLYYCDNEDNK